MKLGGKWMGIGQGVVVGKFYYFRHNDDLLMEVERNYKNFCVCGKEASGD